MHPFIDGRLTWREDVGRVSSDGRRGVYSSNESGRTEVYVTPFPGPGAKVLISTTEGSRPRWWRDGKEIFYLWPTDGQRFLVNTAAEQTASAPITVVNWLATLRK